MTISPHWSAWTAWWSEHACGLNSWGLRPPWHCVGDTTLWSHGCCSDLECRRTGPHELRPRSTSVAKGSESPHSSNYLHMCITWMERWSTFARTCSVFSPGGRLGKFANVILDVWILIRKTGPKSSSKDWTTISHSCKWENLVCRATAWNWQLPSAGTETRRKPA